MNGASGGKTFLRVVAGCSLALLIAFGGGAVFAHGDGSHDEGNRNGNNEQHHGNTGTWSDSGWSDSGWHHHHHHHKMAGFGPLHGPGSSHNPIIDHPVHHPIHGPGSSHNPVVVPVTVVRDHRTPPPRVHHYPCVRFTDHGCGPVRDHRTPPAPQCYGNLC
ncbi:MAG TPA: hypothetical protein VJR71_16680 [Pseudolabrys sp.]|nr:hypothetical protein [Pseudolabrys sp.]